MLKNAFEYPAQQGAYAVKVKSGDDWKAHAACRLHISVGQPYHEGDKLSAAMDWARARFPRVIVCVNDTLQGFTIAFEKGIPRPLAYVEGLYTGDDWETRNGAVLQGADIRRWESWKTWPDYPRAFAQIVALYQSDDAFRAGLDGTIDRFWSRREGKHPAYTPDRRAEFHAVSRDYLLEEVAVICRMIERDRAIDIYPGTMLQVFDLMKGRTLANAPDGLTRRDFARIDFIRKKPPAREARAA
jgi:tRNA-dependent cyclodipeptide synthase